MPIDQRDALIAEEPGRLLSEAALRAVSLPAGAVVEGPSGRAARPADRRVAAGIRREATNRSEGGSTADGQAQNPPSGVLIPSATRRPPCDLPCSPRRPTPSPRTRGAGWPARPRCTRPPSLVLLLAAAAGSRLAPVAGGDAPAPTGRSSSWCRRPRRCRRRCSSSADRRSRRSMPCRRPPRSRPPTGSRYDTSRIRQRREVLFPFLTGRLPFLDELRAVGGAGSASALRNPLGTGRRRRRQEQPPLELSAAARDALVDGSWSRRDRWQSLAKIVELTGRYDPDDGQLPAVVRGHVERNLLQPYLESSPPDPRFWVMLGLAADHLDVIQFVGRYAQQHPSSRTTTELLFLLDELAEANRGAFELLMQTDVAGLTHTAASSPQDVQLALAASARLREVDPRARSRRGEGARRALRRRAAGNPLDHRRDQPGRLRRRRRALPGRAAAVGSLRHRWRRAMVARHGSRRAHDLRHRARRDPSRAAARTAAWTCCASSGRSGPSAGAGCASLRIVWPASASRRRRSDLARLSPSYPSTGAEGAGPSSTGRAASAATRARRPRP